MRIKALFFDFYDTIVKDDSSIIKEYSQDIAKLCGESPENINKLWWKTFHDICNTSSGLYYKKQREIEKLTVRFIINYYKINKKADFFLKNIFHYWENPTLYRDAEFLLKKTSLPVYIVSNIDRQDVITAAMNNSLKFNSIITSEDTQSYKPDPLIFKTALSKFNLRSDEVFHIGDSLNADIKGADNCGIKSIWINRKRITEKKGVTPFREYKDLYQFYNEFKNILNPEI